MNVNATLTFDILVYAVILFLIWLLLLILSKVFMHKEFQKIKWWKIVSIGIILVGGLVGYFTRASAINSILFYLGIILVSILVILYFFYVISSLEGMITIIHKRKYKKRLKDFWICAIIFLVINPFSLAVILQIGGGTLANQIISHNKNPCGVIIGGVMPGSPAYNAGMNAGPASEIITQVNNEDVTNVEQLLDIMNHTKPYDNMNIRTNKREYNITLDSKENSTIGLLGIKMISTFYCSN